MVAFCLFCTLHERYGSFLFGLLRLPRCYFGYHIVTSATKEDVQQYISEHPAVKALEKRADFTLRQMDSMEARSVARPGEVLGNQDRGMDSSIVARYGAPLTTLSTGLAPPDPQQPIGWWLLAISVAGVVFYVAGVVFGGQQAGPGVLRGAGY